MLNDINVKNSWNSLRCKHQLKQITKTREKMLQSMKAAFWEKFVENLKNPSFNILCQITFWNKEKWMTKELVIWSVLFKEQGNPFAGTALKNDKFHLQENFWSHRTIPASLVSVLAHSHETPFKVGQHLKGDRILF